MPKRQRYNQFIACTVLVLCLSALVAAPALHEYLFNHTIAILGEQSSSETGHVPEEEGSCPLCEFLRLAIPHFVDAKPFQLQTGTLAEKTFPVSIPAVACADVLPPCRAPPCV